MKRLLSGVKPSGDLNAGGYGGALRQYAKLQPIQEKFHRIVNYFELDHICRTKHRGLPKPEAQPLLAAKNAMGNVTF